MNNKINKLETKMQNAREIKELINIEANKIHESILKSENIQDWRDLQQRRDSIIAGKEKVIELEHAIHSLFTQIREEEIRVIEENEIDILDAINYYIKREGTEIDNLEIKRYIYKASKENKKFKYYDTDEINSECTKDSFNNKGLYYKKGHLLCHNKRRYIMEIANIIDRLYSNMKDSLEDENNPYIDYEELYKYEKKALKEIKLYCSILQAVYKVKF